MAPRVTTQPAASIASYSRSATPSIALYPRVSKDEQLKGLGIPVQIAGIEAHLARRRTGPSAAEYARPTISYQEDYSGTTLNRPELARLREDVRQGKIAKVIFYAPDRMARNVKDALTLLDEFHAAGVAVEFCTFDWTPTDEGRHSLTMLFAFAEYEVRRIRARTTAGIRMALDRKHYARKPPFGYRRAEKGKDIIVDPVAGPIVQEFFRRYADGATLHDLVRWAAAEGVKSPRENLWQHPSIRKILANDTYLGTAYFGRTIVETPAALVALGPKGGRTPKLARITDPAAWTPVPVPVLVDRATWDRVDQRLRENSTRAKHYGRHSENPALLRAIGICGDCGRHLYAATGHAKKTPRYVCPNRPPTSTCQAGTWNLAVVDAAVRAAFIEFAADPARVCASMLRLRSRDRQKATEKIERLTRNRAGIDGKLRRAVELFVEGAEGIDRATLKATCAKLTAERDVLDVELAIARGAAQIPNAEHMIDWGRVVSHALQGADAHAVGRLLRTVCLRAVLTETEAKLEILADRCARRVPRPRLPHALGHLSRRQVLSPNPVRERGATHHVDRTRNPEHLSRSPRSRRRDDPDPAPEDDRDVRAVAGAEARLDPPHEDQAPQAGGGGARAQA